MYLKWYGDTVGATTAVGAVQLCSAPFVVLYTYNRVASLHVVIVSASVHRCTTQTSDHISSPPLRLHQLIIAEVEA